MKQEQPTAEVGTSSHKNHPKRKIGFGPAAAISVVVLTYFGSQILAALIIGAAAQLFGQNTEAALQSLQDTTWLQFVYILIVEIITLSIIWRFMRHRSVTLADIGLGRGPRASDIGPSLLIFCIYFVALIVVTGLAEQLLPGLNVDQEQQLGFESVTSNADLVLVFLSLAVLPPIVEEILVRGFLYTGLRGKYKKITAAIIASVVFGLAHLQLGSGAAPLWIAAIDTALLSLFLIYLREKTGALWAPMLVHGLKNSLAFLLLFVFVVR